MLPTTLRPHRGITSRTYCITLMQDSAVTWRQSCNSSDLTCMAPLMSPGCNSCYRSLCGESLRAITCVKAWPSFDVTAWPCTCSRLEYCIRSDSQTCGITVLFCLVETGVVAIASRLRDHVWRALIVSCMPGLTRGCLVLDSQINASHVSCLSGHIQGDKTARRMIARLRSSNSWDKQYREQECKSSTVLKTINIFRIRKQQSPHSYTTLYDSIDPLQVSFGCSHGKWR